MAYLALACPLLYITYHIHYQNDNSLVKKNCSYVFIFVMIFILTLFFGLRYNVGIDYMSYYNNSKYGYYNKPQKGTGAIFEPGFLFLYSLVDFFELPPNTIFILCGSIIYICILLTIYKYSISPVLSIFIFLCSGLFFFSFNELRQFVAVSIIFAGYNFCVERSLKKWLIVCFIAFLFHKSALVLIPFYFFNKLNLSKLLINVLVIISLILKKIGVIEVLCTVISYLPGRYSAYAEVLSWMPRNGGTGLIGYLYLFIILIINNISFDIINKSDKIRFYFYIFLFGSIFSNIFSDIYLITRFLEYYIISIVIVFPICIRSLKKSVFSYFVLLFLLAIFSLNFIKYSFYSQPSSLLEYHTVFNKET